MIRRNFLKGFPLLGLSSTITSPGVSYTKSIQDDPNDRAYWVNMLTRVALPVVDVLSANQLKERMPVESHPNSVDRKKVTYLEALGRTLAGLAPWLELGPDETKEGKLRAKFIRLASQSIQNAVTPLSPSFMNFNEGGQPLVDAAFLAHALIRAPGTYGAHLISVCRIILSLR